MRNIKPSNGFTMLELLVALVITGILAVVAIPSITGLLERHRIVTVTDELFSSLQYARTEAVKQNLSVFVSFATGDSWCYGINTGSACDCTTPSSCNLGTKTAPSAQELSLSATGLVSNAITFESTRGAANTTAVLTYTIYGDSDLITTTVSRTGNLQECSTGISGYSTC